MDIDKDIRTWIAEFVSKRNPDLNGFAPCPYAAKALLDDRVKIKIGSAPEIDALELQINDFDSTDVIVFAYDPSMYNGIDFSNRCSKYSSLACCCALNIDVAISGCTMSVIVR